MRWTEIIREDLTDEIEEFLNELNPMEVGHEEVDDHWVYFEGFSEECWDDFERRLKIPQGQPGHVSCIEDVGEEIKAQWIGEVAEMDPGAQLVDNGWWTDDIYYAVFTKTV